MKSNLSLRYGTTAIVRRSLPRCFREHQVPGSDACELAGPFGTIGIQTISAGGITLCDVMADLQQDFTGTLDIPADSLILHVQLIGSSGCSVKMHSHTFDRINHYTFLCLSQQNVSIHIRPQAGMRCIAIVCPVASVRSILSLFPWLEDICTPMQSGENFVSAPMMLGSVLSEKMYQLLHTPYAPTTDAYFCRLLRETIEAALAGYSLPEKKGPVFSQYDISCIQAAKEYVDANLRQHITIEQLARRAGINQLKLKKGFKEIYGIGVYGYQLQQRLQASAVALENTLRSITRIAQQAGFRNLSGFSAAFKGKYGMSPSRYRSARRKDRG